MFWNSNATSLSRLSSGWQYLCVLWYADWITIPAQSLFTTAGHIFFTSGKTTLRGERNQKKNGIGWWCWALAHLYSSSSRKRGKLNREKYYRDPYLFLLVLICTDDAPWSEGFDDSLLASLLCECNNSITWYMLVLVARVRNTQWKRRKKKE